MKRVLIIGAGFVAEPAVEYLHRHGFELTVASHLLEEAQQLADKYSGVKAVVADVTDENQVAELVDGADLVISLVPARLHEAIARVCVAGSTHMVTASYEDDAMKALHEQAVAADVTILNEIGLDPGIDHLSAMQLIDEVHAAGGEIESFQSWCGGLPAPDANDNPLGYKLSWAPRSVLLALLNDAHFVRDGEVAGTPAEQLLSSPEQIELSETLRLEGYPNRDSVSYQQAYGIEKAQTVLRGTLRYRGFCEVIGAARKLGLLNLEANTSTAESWSQLLLELNGAQNLDSLLTRLEISSTARDGLEWLGCFDEQRLDPGPTVLDRFCERLKDKLQYAPGERDMIALQHQFVIRDSDNIRHSHYSTLVIEGESNGFSAMAKTVGYPAAMAAMLILRGTITERGAVLPFAASIYQPILELLEQEGISFTESRTALS